MDIENILIFKEYDYLPEEAKKIRRDVFVEEQGFSIDNEIDENDKIAKHIICYINNEPIATCRVFFDSGLQSYVIGRISVKKEHRGTGLGKKILLYGESCVKKAGGSKVTLSAQQRLSEFYQKYGYKEQGHVYMDEFCPHISMFKEIK